MLCERCKQNPATVHYTQIINGQAAEYHLCESCAREEKLSSDLQEFDLFNLFAPRRDARDSDLICPECHTTLHEFRETGLLGCAKCYDTFSSAIAPMLKQFHGCTAHLKENEPIKEETLEERIKKLQRELESAIASEEYEKAAKVRDEIKHLKGGDEK